MLDSIIDFLNMTVWYIDGISDMRMFHVLIILTCSYCIYDELKIKQSNKNGTA